jgi:hypothetical protein
MQYDVPSTHAPPKALLERSLDASGPRSRVKCCTSGPPRSTPFPVRPSPNRGPKSASGKLLGSYRLACASGIASRTVHETQGLAAGAFLQRALRITDRRTVQVAGVPFRASDPVRTFGSDLGSFGDTPSFMPGLRSLGSFRGVQLRVADSSSLKMMPRYMNDLFTASQGGAIVYQSVCCSQVLCRAQLAVENHRLFNTHLHARGFAEIVQTMK